MDIIDKLYEWYKAATYKGTITEAPNPKVRIKPEQVHIWNGTLTVSGLDNCYIAALADTESMTPVMDAGMFVILEHVNYQDLQVGDIIHRTMQGQEILHRIVEIREDEHGWYCITKGDRVPIRDAVKCRVPEVQGVYRGQIG